MASLTLKNVPDDLLQALRDAAEGDRRSLNQEILHLLSGALDVAPPRPVLRSREVEAQLSAWRKLAGKWKGPAPSIDRSPGRDVDL